jgi:uncharacterized repeat protein (TIGR01451 family)
MANADGAVTNNRITFDPFNPDVSKRTGLIASGVAGAPDQVDSKSIVHHVADSYDLQLSMTIDITATPPGSAFTYTLVYTNQGPFTLYGVVVTDYLAYVPVGQASKSPMPYVKTEGRPLYWKLVALSPDAGSTFNCILGTLAPGQTGVLVMNAQLLTNIPYDVNLMNNHVVIADDGTQPGDIDPSNQVASVSTPIQGSDLAILNPHIEGDTSPGELFTVTATIINRGLTNTVTWERVITPENSANNWFAVEVYLRPADWEAGPPSGPHDHAGGLCSSQTVPCDEAEQRAEYVHMINYSSGLVPFSPYQVSFPVSVPTVEAYLVYVQVDTGFWFFDDPPYGRVLEFDESNNLVLLGLAGSVNQAFLPIIFRR